MADIKRNGCLFFNRQPFFLCPMVYVFLLLFTMADVANASDVEQQLKFATPELRLQLIDQYQPGFDENPDDWYVWEHQRFNSMVELGEWRLIDQRVQSLEIASPDKVLPWMKQFQALSFLKTSQPGRARKILADLMWLSESATTESIAKWRQMLIRSYLASDRFEDARRAMLRYRQDYGEQGLDWTVLQTKVLLSTGRFEEAVSRIDNSRINNEKSIAVAPLKLLSRFRAGLDAPDRVYTQAISQALSLKNNIPEQLRRQYWMVALIAARHQKNWSDTIEALENILVTGHVDPVGDIENISVDDLWQAYLDYGSELGNQLHLLVGADQQWYTEASDRFDKNPVQARALFAVIGTRATSQQHRDLAHKQLVALLLKQQQGLDLIEKLFTRSQRFQDTEKVPLAVRHQLVDYALSRGKIKQAASLLQELSEPPDNKDKFNWNIRRARVLILGGHYASGADVLAAMLESTTLNEQQINQLMQVMFDLQNVDQHQLAINLFIKLEQVITNAELLRELKFWQAQSYHGLHQYTRAAHLYLTSALMDESKLWDPWSQTARYKAAESLTEAGLIDDARNLYRELLKRTENKARKSVIRQRLQHLWLLEGRKSNTHPES